MTNPSETGKRALPEAIKADSNRFVFMDNPVVDNLVSTVLELSAQVWTLRRRVLVTEKLLESKGIASVEEIETFVPSDEDQAAWQAERDRYVRSVFASFSRNIPLDEIETPSSFLDR